MPKTFCVTHTRCDHYEILTPYLIIWLRMKLRVSASVLVLKTSTNSKSLNPEPLDYQMVDTTYFRIVKYPIKSHDKLVKKTDQSGVINPGLPELWRQIKTLRRNSYNIVSVQS